MLKIQRVHLIYDFSVTIEILHVSTTIFKTLENNYNEAIDFKIADELREWTWKANPDRLEMSC